MRLIGTIENAGIVELNDGAITFTSKAAICVDGSGPAHGDPDYQNDTALHQNGKALNADTDRYIVVPPLVIWAVRGIVLGCQAYAMTLKNGRWSEAVAGDIGPHDKIGEISRALALELGIDPSPVDGGEESHSIFYSLYPGKYAVVAGKQYSLQAA